jgi:hypothetical protein
MQISPLFSSRAYFLQVVSYFPLIPHLQRYFADKKEAKLMSWHASRKNKHENMLRHPAHGSHWKTLDHEYPLFAAEARNLRLGCSTDGPNPFDNQSSTHST